MNCVIDIGIINTAFCNCPLQLCHGTQKIYTRLLTIVVFYLFQNAIKCATGRPALGAKRLPVLAALAPSDKEVPAPPSGPAPKVHVIHNTPAHVSLLHLLFYAIPLIGPLNISLLNNNNICVICKNNHLKGASIYLWSKYYQNRRLFVWFDHSFAYF